MTQPIFYTLISQTVVGTDKMEMSYLSMTHRSMGRDPIYDLFVFECQYNLSFYIRLTISYCVSHDYICIMVSLIISRLTDVVRNVFFNWIRLKPSNLCSNRRTIPQSFPWDPSLLSWTLSRFVDLCVYLLPAWYMFLFQDWTLTVVSQVLQLVNRRRWLGLSVCWWGHW